MFLLSDTPIFLLSVFAFLNASANPTAPTCQDFAQNTTFDENHSLGLWHLIHYRTAKANGTGNPHCLEFSVVDEEDRDILRDKVGKFVQNLDWDNMSLRMTIPCQELSYKKKRHYYLEKEEGNGAYRTILLPFSETAASFTPSKLSRYVLRLKMVEDKYLAMMDCHERYIFVLGKQFPTGTETEKRLANMVEAYWGN